MKNKVTLAISTLVLFGSVATSEAANKHHSTSKTAKHTSATAHKTSHHSSSSKSHSKHAHTTHYHAHHQPSFHHIAASNHNPNQGTASLYSSRFQGKQTASGEKYDMYEMTAAHRSLPLLSYVEVTNVKNHRSVVVRINDRGPFHGNRVMDLSTAAAEELGIDGVGSVTITPLAMN